MGPIYAGTRARITELVTGLEGGDAERPVPTCPEWTVREVLAHLAGACADILALNLEGVASDAWTDAQVTARKDDTLAEIVDEWSELGPQVEALVNDVPGRRPQQLVLDVTEHEHDIRLALGRPGGRDADAVHVGLDFLVAAGIAPSLAIRRLGVLEIRTPERTWRVGAEGPPPTSDPLALRAEIDAATARIADGVEEPSVVGGTPDAVLEVESFELFRGLTGRRSAAQIARWDWSVDPAPWVPGLEFGPFHFAADDIDE